MTLRARLVAAAATATLLAVGALGVAAALLSAHELNSSLDRALRGRALEISRLSASDPALLGSSGALDSPFGGRELSVEVLDRAGRIYARSMSLGALVLSAGRAVHGALAGARTTRLDGHIGREPVRMVVAPLPDTGGPVSGGAVIVASSTREIDDTVSNLGSLVLLSALAAGGLGAAAAALLTQRGLRPLQRLSETAARIARARAPSERMPVPPGGGELAELARTLNTMLAALERALQTERRFLADASHELRTPLTSLRGNAAYIAAHGADPVALRDIEGDAARLARLLDDLLALEREEGAARPEQELALAELARTVVAAEPHARLRVAAPAVRVRGERGALERALRNLIENARVHGPAGAAIDVAVEQHGSLALLSVADAGPGLNPADAARAVQRFWRGPGAAERPGSGLGLSIVASTAARHGGTLRIEGSRFTLALPLLRNLSGNGA